MKRTGKFATKEEMKKALKLVREAQSTPMIALTSADALSGNDFSSRAWRSAQEYVHALALHKGLPEIKGFYGLNKDGEFVTV